MLTKRGNLVSDRYRYTCVLMSFPLKVDGR
jgi:hypothetical protein